MSEFLIALFAALQAYDGYSTRWILARGGSEANPVVKWVMERIGLTPALLLLKVGAFLGFLFVLELLPEAAYALVAIYGWVAYNNARVINQLKEQR